MATNKNNELLNSTNEANKPSSDIAKNRAMSGKNKSDVKSGNPREKIKVISNTPSDEDLPRVGDVNKRAKKEEKKLKKTKTKSERRSDLKRRSKANKKINKAKVLIVLIILLVASAIGAFVVLATTDVVEIDEVEFVGADHLTSAECDALCQSPKGESLLTFDADKIKQAFTRDSWVKDVKFNRIFPHKLQIVIEEKPIAAFVDFAIGSSQTSQTWILATDGTWIMGVPDKESETGKQISQQIFVDNENCIHITDCPNGISPKIGAKCTDDTLLNALEIINGFTTSLKDDIKSISASSVTATTLKLRNNVEIAFGEATSIRDKERIAREIMEQNSKVIYINVRNTERPTWKSVEASS